MFSWIRAEQSLNFDLIFNLEKTLTQFLTLGSKGQVGIAH